MTGVSRAQAVVPLLFAIASVRDERVSRRFAIGWIVLTVVLATYAVVLDFGPRVETPGGLSTQVVAQTSSRFSR